MLNDFKDDTHLRVNQPHTLNKAADDLDSKERALEREEEVDSSHPSWISQLRAFIRRLDKWGVEVNGIERISPEKRTQKSIFDIFTMWMAANCNISAFSLGTLGSSVFNLGFRHSLLTIIIFNAFSAIPVGYFSAFGAKSGLRQMVFSRFAFGYWTCMIPGILNVIACIGWGTINSIVGAQALRTVSSTHPLPIWAGITIIAVLGLIPSFSGYKYVHVYERYAWLAPAIVFFIILGESRAFMGNTSSDIVGKARVASILSFGGSLAGAMLGWVSYSADYTVHLPENSSSWKIFLAAYFGNIIPAILIEALGAAMMTTLRVQPSWQAQYDSNGIGGLLGAGLSPLKGFGRFLTVILGLSVVANNVPTFYSLALTVQIFGRAFAAIPRAIITLAGTGLCVTLALIGASRFVSLLETLLVFLGYWSIIYIVILTQEHLIFRRGSFSNYNWSDIDCPELLPKGFASGLALCVGIIGAILGMSQKWYVGPIGRLIGTKDSGGDIGFELSFIFTALAYLPLRYLERKRFGH